MLVPALSMNNAATLKSIAGLLLSLADEVVEPLLVAFDALVDVADPSCRAEAAQLSRDQAAAGDNPLRRARLSTAADALAAGDPCARTAAGLTWREEAEEAGRTSPEEWSERAAALPPVTQLAPDTPPVLVEPLKFRLPRLRVCHFLPGLVVRLSRPVTDTTGRIAPAGQRLRLLTTEVQGSTGAAVWRLHFHERSLRLDAIPQDDRSIIGNGGNAGFWPLPTRSCLRALWEIVDNRLDAAERALDAEDEPDQLDGDMLLAVRTDVDDCGDWLAGEGAGPPPRPECAPVAAEYFGRKSDMVIWVALLFTAIPHCQQE